MSDESGTHNYYNAAHSQIGSQGGVVYGGVHFGDTRTDGEPTRSLSAQVEDLLKALNEVRAEGYLDEATYAEANGALEEAHANADAADEASRSAFLRALRKAQCLVEEVGGLVGAIAAVISAVAGIR